MCLIFRYSFGGSGLRLCFINKRADIIDNKGFRLFFFIGVIDQFFFQVECEEVYLFFVKDKGMNSYIFYIDMGIRIRKYLYIIEVQNKCLGGYDFVDR